jgi:hypothetical protein
MCPQQLDTGTTTISFRQMMGEIHMNGRNDPNCTPGEDEESQKFFAEVERLNPNWKPGQVPKVPRPRRHVRTTQKRPEGRVRPSARSPRRRSVRSGGAKARAPDEPSESEPPLDAVPLSRFRRDVRRWLKGAA